MKAHSDTIHLSATDLANHMYCPHLTSLNLKEIKKLLKAPYFHDPALIALQEKGEQFEKNYITELKASGKKVMEINRGDPAKAAEETISAMQQGAEIIYQARLRHDIWNGWADFLIRVNKPSDFGNWSYEVLDTKLSKETKSGAILQTSLYSEILEHLQGCRPEYLHIKNPNGEHTFRTDDFAAYYRFMKRKLIHALSTDEGTYPQPVPHCDVCRWWTLCNEQRRHDDHLSFIAGMRTSQTMEVKKWNITTLESMAGVSLPLKQKPERGSAETYEKLAHQARLQLRSRKTGQTVFEILPLKEDLGLYKLPEPSEHDIFFDFEGDPYAGSTGLEYLFGWYYQNRYHHLWAHNELEEKQALENFLDQVMEICKESPQMHIYHFGAYEQTALKRLVGKYAIREDELDRLLRGKVFVNLHTILRHSIIAGVERYSLKDMEKLHGYERAIDLRIVGSRKLLYEGMLESGSIDSVDEETKNIVRDYNRDDCISAQYLRDWLEKLRKESVQKGNNIPRPIAESAEPSEKITEHQQRIRPLFTALMKDIPFEKENRTAEQQAKWLLANMLDWYRREQKSEWWEYFRLMELSEEDLLDEKDAISKLEYTGKRDFILKSVIDYYRYPEQEFDLDSGDKVKFRGKSAGLLYVLDRSNCEIGLKKGPTIKDLHPTYIINHDIIDDGTKENALIRIAEWVVKNGITADGTYKAGRELLLRSLPDPQNPPGSFADTLEEAICRVKNLNSGVLPIQGPPGTGKSHTASRMIVDLIIAGKKIGITALSHKVIAGLLEKVTELAKEKKIDCRIVQKVRDLAGIPEQRWEEVENNDDVIERIQRGYNIIAGTAFMWARPEFFETVDYMFVDEAGQLSLIDTIALSHAATNLVLFGDPQQLKQPQKGSHPEGTDVSALEHILQDQKTISREQGVFLDKTWRMHPAIAGYISELFYDNRLESVPGTARQKLEGSTIYQHPGIYFHGVQHDGNQSSSNEEADKAVAIVKSLTGGGVYFIRNDGSKHAITREDIKIIAPYNAQVNTLKRALPLFQIGTVDKFQGQEAPVVIFSMATSSPEDAPRGLEFLYSLNRLNVAVSRAKAVFILVASPALFDPACKSPHHMKLANALCRLRELAVTAES